MRIYIPTLGRVEAWTRPENRQLTFHWIPVEWKKHLWLCVHQREADAFSWWEQKIVVDKVGAPHARQQIVEHATRSYEDPRIAMFDDDLRFARREKDWVVKFGSASQSTEQDVSDALEMLFERLNEYAMVGISARQGNQSRPERIGEENKRMMRSFGVRTDVLHSTGIRFDKYPFWEDFHVALSLLRRGYPNYLILEHMTDGITNKPGGCAEYRTNAALAACREAFLAEHAPYAQPNDKSTSAWSGAEAETAPDLRISWLKAFEERDLATHEQEQSQPERQAEL